MKKKYIKMPTTFDEMLYDNEITEFNGCSVIDLNKMLWRFFLSKGFIQQQFKKYKSTKGSEYDIVSRYIYHIEQNIDTILNVVRSSSEFINEKIIWYYYQIISFILKIYNLTISDYTFSMAYGFNYHQIEGGIEIDDNDSLRNIFLQIVNGDFFEDDTEYIISYHFQNELHFIILLSTILKNKFRNTKITVSLAFADEQMDFTSWFSSESLSGIIDCWIDTSRDNSLATQVYPILRKSKVTTSVRLFTESCFWQKCTFCTINSGWKNKKGPDRLTEKVEARIDSILKSLLVHPCDILFFQDEAIESSILLYFADEVIRLGIKTNFCCRTRITKNFTKENCLLLSTAGFTNISMGLECVSDRVSKLMNKRECELTMNEISDIFDNFENANINIHLYSILGFPSETKDETNETLTFLESILRNYNYFSYTANVFYLMKNSAVYLNPSLYKIYIDEKNTNKISDIDYIDESHSDIYSRNELFRLQKICMSKMFLKKDAPFDTCEVLNSYWEYLDRSGLFYSLKMFYKVNPFINRCTKNEKIDLNDKYVLLPIFKMNDNRYYNLAISSYVENYEVDELFTSVYYLNYNNTVSLRSNIVSINKVFMNENKADEDYSSKYTTFSKYLYNNYILIKQKTL